MLYQPSEFSRTRKYIAVLLSVAAVVIALVFVFLIIGHWVVVPVLWNLMEPRIDTGVSPSALEVVIVFVVATAYMLFIAVLVIAAGCSGWIYLHAHDKAQKWMEIVRSKFGSTITDE